MGKTHILIPTTSFTFCGLWNKFYKIEAEELSPWFKLEDVTCKNCIKCRDKYLGRR